MLLLNGWGFMIVLPGKTPGNPQCFCFIKGKVVNPERNSSETCQQYLLLQDSPLGPQNYSRANSKPASQTGCLTRQGAFDLQCRCRQQQTPDGNNNCQKTSFVPSEFRFGGLASTVGGLLRNANRLTNGENWPGWFTGEFSGTAGGQIAPGLAKGFPFGGEKITRPG